MLEWEYVHMSTVAHAGQKHWLPLKLELYVVVSYPTWDLKLNSGPEMNLSSLGHFFPSFQSLGPPTVN